LIGLVIVVAFTFIGAYLILQLTNLILPMKVSASDKKVGQDMTQHGENLYPAGLTLAKESAPIENYWLNPEKAVKI
jgi:ammonium transporter, Amt family